MTIINEYIIMCPPLSKYPTPPDDQPDCEIEICPICKKDMWISKKKRNIRFNYTQLNPPSQMQLTIFCYDCLMKKSIDGYFERGSIDKINI